MIWMRDANRWPRDRSTAKGMLQVYFNSIEEFLETLPPCEVFVRRG